MKSPDRVPPTLSPQPTTKTSIQNSGPAYNHPSGTDRDIQQFVRDVLTEIRHSQRNLNKRLFRLRESFNDLEKRVKELEKMALKVDQYEKQLTDHAEIEQT